MMVEEFLEEGKDIPTTEGVVMTEGTVVNARDLVRALLRDGFELRRKRGSHERYAHEDGRRVTVPYTRRGDTFAIGTLRSIIERQARWTIDDLKRLALLP